MHATLTQTIRNHVNELDPPPRAIWVKPDDYRDLRHALSDFELRERPIWLLCDPDIPKGCYRLSTETSR